MGVIIYFKRWLWRLYKINREQNFAQCTTHRIHIVNGRYCNILIGKIKSAHLTIIFSFQKADFTNTKFCLHFLHLISEKEIDTPET